MKEPQFCNDEPRKHQASDVLKIGVWKDESDFKIGLISRRQWRFQTQLRGKLEIYYSKPGERRSGPRLRHWQKGCKKGDRQELDRWVNIFIPGVCLSPKDRDTKGQESCGSGGKQTCSSAGPRGQCA